MAETKVSAAEREPEAQAAPPRSGRRSFRDLLRSAEVDSRLAGMLVALAIIWILFQIITPNHTFLTSRNLWNLSVQTAVVAIMATGMVLIIVTRNIDLSVGAVMAAVGMAMAVVQHDWLPEWIGFDHPLTWVIAIAVGLVLGAAIGAFQGSIVAYVGVPSFIVTLGGFLVWRGVAGGWRADRRSRPWTPCSASSEVVPRARSAERGAGSSASRRAWGSCCCSSPSGVSGAGTASACARCGRRWRSP